MARRRRRKGRSGAEAIFGIIVAAVALTWVSAPSIPSFISNVLWFFAVIAAIGLGIWFIKGLIESALPIDPKTGKTKTFATTDAEPDSLPKEWTRELIDRLEWRVFEKLCTRLWEEKGSAAKDTGAGADGGVDFYLYANATNQKIGAVQCKSWGWK